MRAGRVEVVEVHRPNRQARRRQGKSDPFDALEAARAAVQGGRALRVAKTRDGSVEAMPKTCIKCPGNALTRRVNHRLARSSPWPPPAVPAPAGVPLDEAFISYSHADQRRVRALVADLGELEQTAWWDSELPVGKDWWDQICAHIRSCRLFIFALSVASNRSEACRRELAYALSLRKPVLPVLVGENVPVALAPALARIQYADLRGPHRRARAALRKALDDVRRAPAPAAPVPAPAPPPAPIPDLGDLPDRVAAPYLPVDEQDRVARALIARLSDSLSFDAALSLLHELAARTDLDRSVRRRIDTVLRNAEEDKKKRLLLGVPLPVDRVVDHWKARPRPRPKLVVAGTVVAAGAVAGAVWILIPDDPALAGSPTNLDFGAVTIGTQAGPWSLALNNNSGNPVDVGTVTIQGDLAGETTVTGCADTALAPSASCVMQLTFTPTSTGRRTGQLVATSSRGDVNVALTGAGVGVGQIAAEPGAVTFDPLHPGQSASRTITLRNAGSAPVKIGSAHIANSTVEDITVTGCQDVQLGPAQTCELVVTVTPTKVGDWQANVEIATDGDVVATVLARGTTVGTPRVVPASTSVTFDRTVVGKTTEAQTIRIDNNGDGATRVDDVTTTGAHASEFIVEGCSGAELAPEKSCALSIRFAPAASGTRLAALEVRTADGGQLTIDLQGAAVGAGVPKLDPTAVGFEDNRINATSKPRTVVVTNVGASDLDVKGPDVSGNNATDFSATGCQNVRLPPGKTCNVTVVMTPTALGPRSALLVVGVSEGTGPTATLTGTGTASSDLGVSVANNNDGVHVSVLNRGPDRAADVVVTVNVTGGTITDVDDPCTKIDDKHATCLLGALGPNAQRNFPLSTFKYDRNDTSDVVLTFRVHSTSVDPDLSNDSYRHVDHDVQ